MSLPFLISCFSFLITCSCLLHLFSHYYRKSFDLFSPPSIIKVKFTLFNVWVFHKCMQSCSHHSQEDIEYFFHYSKYLHAFLWSTLPPDPGTTHLFLSIYSVQFSRSVVSDSLRPHESQHTRPPCPSPSPGVHSNSRPSSRRCHPAISSSVVPFSSSTQSLPASVISNESTLHMRWPEYWSFQL